MKTIGSTRPAVPASTRVLDLLAQIGTSTVPRMRLYLDIPLTTLESAIQRLRKAGKLRATIEYAEDGAPTYRWALVEPPAPLGTEPAEDDDGWAPARRWVHPYARRASECAA